MLVSALRSNVARSSRAGELHGRDAPRSHDVVHLVVALVQHARRFHPPVDVPVPVQTGTAHVLADGEDDVAAGATYLGSDLHAGGGCADHHDAAIRELTRGCGTPSASSS